MSQPAIDLSEVKSIIRGLIISSVAVTSIRQLEIDYRKQEGTRIPYLLFGYPSVEAFLRSIPDTVNLREPSRGCPSYMTIVEPVQSKKSEHVERMVTKQRVSKPIHGIKRSSAVPGSQVQKRSDKESSKLHGLAPRFIPLALRTSLARVLQRWAPHGLPLSSLGTELARDLSMAGWSEGGKSGWLSVNGFSSTKEVIDELKDQGLIKITTLKGKEWVIHSVPNGSDGHKTSSEVENRRIARHRLSSDTGVVPGGLETGSDEDWSDAEVVVSDRMKKNFRDILAKHPNGLWCASLPHEYKIHTGGELDVKQVGFVSVVQMASKLKDVFICTRPDTNSDWLLFDCHSNNLWNCSAAPTGKGNQMPSLPTKYIRNIESLLVDHPNGLENAKFLETYKAKYKEDFPLIDFGFENMMALLGHLAKRNVVHLKFTDYIPMVCKPSSYPDQKDVFGGLKEDGDFINALYPMGVVGYNEVIPLQELPDDLEPGCSFDIQVTEVASPSKFWYQIWGNKTYAEFDEMMDNMQKFYDSDGPSMYKMPDAVIMIGQFCATRFPPGAFPNSEWHRAKITSLPSLTEAEVYYVDYGSTLKIRRSEIYFLDSRFSELPMQALPARLTNIRPIGYGLWKKLRHTPTSKDMSQMKPSWSKLCMPFFISLVGNKPTVAAVTHIRRSDNCLSVGLTDTTADEDRHINDMFVSQHLAEFGEMTDDEDDSPRPDPHKACSDPTASTMRECESPSSQKMPLPLTSPKGSSSSLPPKRPIMTENGHDHPIYDRTLSPLESAYRCTLPESRLHDFILLGKGLGGGQAEREDRPMGEQSLVEKTNKEAEEARMLKNMIEEEMKSLEMHRKLEEVRQLELRKLEEKAKQEAQLRLELQKLQIQQKLLDLQQQQYQAQLLLLSTENGIMPPGIFSGNQASLLSSPCGMVNMMPPPGMQAVFPQLQQSNSLSSLMRDPFQSLLASGNFPIQNQAYTQWNHVGSDFGTLPPCGFGGVGDNFTSKPIACAPGFEHLHNTIGPLQIPNSMKMKTFNNPGVVPNGIVSSEGGSLPTQCDHKEALPKEFRSTPENISNEANAGRDNSNDFPKTLDRSLLKGLPVPVNTWKTASNHPLKSGHFCKPLNFPNTNNVGQSQNENIIDDPVNDSKADVPSSPITDINSLSSLPPESKSDTSECSSTKVKSRGRTISREVRSELNAMLQSCNISTGYNLGSSAAFEGNKNQKYIKVEEKEDDCDARGKWRIRLKTPSSEDDNPDIIKGCLDGKEVNVVNVNGVKCVLTEEILGLFFNNIPVHVALKIAELRPNGHKIESVTLNPLKDRALCKKISSLNVIEINPRGSDVHLITADSLYYLCMALSYPE